MIEVRVPDEQEGTKAVVRAWLKKVGEAVAVNDPLVELETRWELSPEHPWAAHGIPESMSIDQTLHSLFGASKVAADVLVQEYGRYFGMKTVCPECVAGRGPAPRR